MFLLIEEQTLDTNMYFRQSRKPTRDTSNLDLQFSTEAILEKPQKGLRTFSSSGNRVSVYFRAFEPKF